MAEAFQLDGVAVIPDELTVHRAGKRLSIEPRAMSLLLVLASEPGRVFTRDELFDAVWGQAEVSDQALTNAIWELRQALADSPRQSRFIRTIPRRGYKLLVSPRPLEGPAEPVRPAPRFAHWLAPLLLVLLAAIAAGWFFHTRTDVASSLPTNPGLEAWRFQTGGEIHTDPLVIGDDLIFGSHDGFVYRLTLFGEERWRTRVGGPVEYNLASDGERLYVVAMDGYCYALDLDSGRELWRRRVDPNSPPATTRHGVLIAGYDHTLWHLDAESGEAEAVLDDVGVVLLAPIVMDNLAVLIEENGRTSAIDLREPRLRWRKQLEGGVTRPPTVTNGVLYLGSDGGYVYALDLQDGTEIWRARVSPRNAGGTSVNPRDERLFVATEPGELVALDLATGAELWRVSGGSFFSPPATAHGVVFAGNGDGAVYAVDASSGRMLWRVAVGPWLLTRPALTGGLVVIGDAAGHLNAIPLSGHHAPIEQPGEPELPAPELLGSVDLGAPITIAPATDGKALFVPADDMLVALELGSQAVLWRYPALGAIHGQPTVGGGRVWFTTRAGQLLGVPVDGSADVIEAALPEASISGPLWLGDGVVLGDQAGNVHRYGADGDRRWTTRVSPAPHSVNADPLLVDGQIVIGSCDGFVYALDPVEGSILWRLNIGECVVADVIAGPELLYIGAADGSFVAFDRRGRERWRFNAEGEIWYQPALAAGRIVFGSRDYHFYALDALSGEELWRYRTGNRALSDVVYDGSRFVAGSYDGCVYALDGDTGRPDWRFCAGRELINPMLLGGRVIVGGDDGVLYTLSGDAASVQY